jgi:hypothetical protein
MFPQSSLVVALAVAAVSSPCDTAATCGAVAASEHPPVGCYTYACEVRVKRNVRADIRRRHRQHWRYLTAPYRAWLASTRQCESGGNYRTATGNGFWGAYQFTLTSWAAVGGHGNPANAEPLEQDYRAVLLLHLQGRGAWPVCG